MSDVEASPSPYDGRITSLCASALRNRCAGGQPSGATDAVDDESFADERRVIEQVTQIDDRAAPHHPREGLGVEGAKFLPFRGDHYAIGSRTGIPRRSAEFHIGEEPPGMRHALGIEHSHRNAGLLQALDESKGRRFAHIIRVGLECKPQDRHHAVFDLAFEGAKDALCHGVLACLVGRDRAGDDVELDPLLPAVASMAPQSLGKQEPP